LTYYAAPAESLEEGRRPKVKLKFLKPLIHLDSGFSLILNAYTLWEMNFAFFGKTTSEVPVVLKLPTGLRHHPMNCIY